MRFMKSMMLAAVALLALALAGSAAATSISPANTAFSASSSDSVLTLAGTTMGCTTSVVSGTTPGNSATTATVSISLRYSGCAAFGFAGTTWIVGTSTAPVTSCTGAKSVFMSTLYNGTSGRVVVHIPSGCTVYISAGCMTPSKIIGPATIGTSQSNAFYTNGSSSVFTTLTLSSAPVLVTAGTFPCVGGGGTLSGTYTVTAPATAPGITVNP